MFRKSSTVDQKPLDEKRAISSDVDSWIARFSERKLLLEEEIVVLTERARDIFFSESDVTHVSSPVTVCGDVIFLLIFVLDPWTVFRPLGVV